MASYWASADLWAASAVSSLSSISWAAVSSDMSPRFWKPDRSCIRISRRERALPCPSSMEMPSWSIAACAAFEGLARLVMTLLRLVPAADAFIPALAIRPRATDTSSTE